MSFKALWMLHSTARCSIRPPTSFCRSTSCCFASVTRLNMLAWLAAAELLLSKSPFNNGLSWHLESSANATQTKMNWQEAV